MAPESISLAGAENRMVRNERAVFTLDDLRNWKGAASATLAPYRLAVIGDPVAHSASPAMQNAALAAGGVNARYTRLHIRPNELSEALRRLAPAGFIGANLTLPHKTAALPLLDFLDPHAAELGAVNTVRVESDGLRGFNTDGPGFARAVRADLGMLLRGKRVLILGAGGGAGRALAAQCALEGCARLFLVNRTFEKVQGLAEDLAARFNTEVRAVEWVGSDLAEVLPDADLVINTSALGLKTDDLSPLAAEQIPPSTFVFDTVYRRGNLPTPLMAAAKNAGVPVVGGLSLLLHQGALAFEIWFRQAAPLEIMRVALQVA